MKTITETLTRIGPYIVEDFDGTRPIFYSADPKTGKPILIKGPQLIDIVHEGLSPLEIGSTCLEYEAQLQQRAKHSNICPAELIKVEGIPYIIMPHLGHVSLFDYKTGLVHKKTNALEDIATALDHCHKKGIVHLDVKEENIMMQGDKAILIDFGAARELEGEHPISQDLIQCTPEAVAPEYKQNSKYNTRSDTFSFAFMAHKMLTGIVPFHIQNKNIQYQVPRIRADRIERYDPKLAELIVNGLSIRHRERPEIGELADALANYNAKH